MKKHGLLIAFEGLHGCGKSTQIELLADRLRKDGKIVKTTKEISGTPIADEIRQLMANNIGGILDDPLSLTILIAASRASRVKAIILPSLESGDIVLADRYESSMVVEQHYGQGVERATVDALNKIAIGNTKADLTFLIDLNPKEAFERRKIRSVKFQPVSFWDSKPESYHQKSRAAYLELVKTESNWKVLNGMRTVKKIHDEIYMHVTEYTQRMGHE